MKKLALTIGALAIPVVSFAQLGKVGGLVTDIGNIVGRIIPILFALALLGFFWGLIGYIFGKEENKEAKKKTMIWGVIALFIMASIWGLVSFIGGAIGVDNVNAPNVNNIIPK